LLAFVSAALVAPLQRKTTLSCSLGDDSYNAIVLTPSDETWPIDDPAQGVTSIDFGGYRFGGMFLGSYRFASAQVLKFAVVSAGDPATLVVGTISVLTAAHPVLRVIKGPYSFFVSSGAVNPALTIMANALRVADHIKERLR
jgi:hypothetical protein